MSTNNSNNNNAKRIDPYKDRESAIAYLRQKGIIVNDEARVYHSMTFQFPERLSTSRELDIIQSLGKIAFIDFSVRMVYIFTAVDHVMKERHKEK